MFLFIIHSLIVCVYIAAPVAAIVIDAVRARRDRRFRPGARLIGVVIVGTLVGAAMAMLYAVAVGGGVRLGQLMLASYFAIGMLLILRVFDWLLSVLADAAFCVDRSVQHASVGAQVRGSLAWFARVIVLFGVGLPYVMSTVLTYRPKVALRDDPQTQLGFQFEEVAFTATDGTPLSGWWIPAQQSRSHPAAAADTVLICHGLASNKSNQLILARGFVPCGYNVLIFDFRAHGDSGGQITSFGDLERADVLGAVRFLRQRHSANAQHIYGVGASMGAAALIAAAAERSPEGQAIDAIAAYGTYDSVPAEMRYVAAERFIQPLRWLVERLCLPIASAQSGANLADFSPATLVQSLWPRPILVIHGMNDSIIDFTRGQTLFKSASQPKTHLWVDHAGHNDIINDENVAKRVREFFQSAEPLPVI